MLKIPLVATVSDSGLVFIAGFRNDDGILQPLDPAFLEGIVGLADSIQGVKLNTVAECVVSLVVPSDDDSEPIRRRFFDELRSILPAYETTQMDPQSGTFLRLDIVDASRSTYGHHYRVRVHAVDADRLWRALLETTDWCEVAPERGLQVEVEAHCLHLTDVWRRVALDESHEVLLTLVRRLQVVADSHPDPAMRTIVVPHFVSHNRGHRLLRVVA